MEFRSHTQTASFHSPLADFDLVDAEVEVRVDPLTERTARIADGAFPTADEYDIESVVGDAEGCFFCPGTVEDATPTYGDWFDADRGSRGEATSFPNLNPYGSYSNVVALTETHFQPMEEFSTEQFADGLAAALDYVGAVMDHDPDADRASVNMNFLRSAGSSLVHPHMQTLVDEYGTNEFRSLLDASMVYHEENWATYWTDLVDAERDGDRWIGETPGVDWLAAFAPKHHRHVMGVARDVGVPDSDGDAVQGFAEGLTGVLASYAAEGLNAFNFALHVVDDESMPPVMNVIARSVFDEYYWSDSPFFTVLHDEGVVATPPETYAEDCRGQF